MPDPGLHVLAHITKLTIAHLTHFSHVNLEFFIKKLWFMDLGTKIRYSYTHSRNSNNAQHHLDQRVKEFNLPSLFIYRGTWDHP